MYVNTKIFVNGTWVGVVSKADYVTSLLINSRRNGLIPIYTSISWDIKRNSIFIYTDYGRLCHPVYYVNDNKVSINNAEIIEIFRNIIGHDDSIEVFTTRPDTIFGVSFMTLAPDHELTLNITTNENRAEVLEYIN